VIIDPTTAFLALFFLVGPVAADQASLGPLLSICLLRMAVAKGTSLPLFHAAQCGLRADAVDGVILSDHKDRAQTAHQGSLRTDVSSDTAEDDLY